MKITVEEAKLWSEIFKGFAKGKEYQFAKNVDENGNVTEYKKVTGKVDSSNIRTLEISQGMFLLDPNIIEEVGKKKTAGTKKEKKSFLVLLKKIFKGILNG